MMILESKQPAKQTLRVLIWNWSSNFWATYKANTIAQSEQSTTGT